MKYIIKVVSMCPDGAVVGIKYLIAENEKRMESILKLDCDYVCFTCIGPESKLPDSLEEKIKKIK